MEKLLNDICIQVLKMRIQDPDPNQNAMDSQQLNYLYLFYRYWMMNAAFNNF